MTVKCPKHKTELTIEHSTLELLGEKTSAVIGSCPDCKNRYINRHLVLSASKFTLNGTHYEFLQALNDAFPYDPVAEQQRIEEEKKRAKKAAAKAKKQKRREKELKVIADSRLSFLAQHPNKAYRPTFITQIAEIPSICPRCNEPLVYLRVQKRGLVDGSGWCCLPCARLFISPTTKALTYKPKYIIVPEPDMKKSSNQKQASSKTPPKKGNIHLPTEIKEIPKSTIMLVRLKNKITDSCKTIAIVSEAQEQNANLGVYWVGRSFPSMILSAIQTNGEIEYHGEKFVVDDVEEYSSAKKYLGIIGRFCNTSAPQVVYVFSQKHLSTYTNAGYEAVTAMVPCANRIAPVPITVYYEKATKRYFMNEESYVLARKTYGLPYIKLRMAGANPNRGTYGALKEHSELNLLGYSVRMTDGLDMEARRRLLSTVLDSRIMEKPDIMNHLEWLIHTRSHMPNMANALGEWRSDLQFVLQYKIQKQRHILVRNFKVFPRE